MNSIKRERLKYTLGLKVVVKFSVEKLHFDLISLQNETLIFATESLFFGIENTPSLVTLLTSLNFLFPALRNPIKLTFTELLNRIIFRNQINLYKSLLK